MINYWKTVSRDARNATPTTASTVGNADGSAVGKRKRTPSRIAVESAASDLDFIEAEVPSKRKSEPHSFSCDVHLMSCEGIPKIVFDPSPQKAPKPRKKSRTTEKPSVEVKREPMSNLNFEILISTEKRAPVTRDDETITTDESDGTPIEHQTKEEGADDEEEEQV